MGNCTYIDGIASSQAIDTAGEIVDLMGLDCSSLIGAAFNFEHKSDVPAQIVGKVLEYKKIFSDQDCETDRQRYYWEKCKIPFLYVLGRLFDDKKDSSKEVAALFRDDAENPNEPNMVGFSIEGAKIHKEGMTIKKSIARKVTITNLPANKTCVAQMIPSKGAAPKDDIDSLFKGEVEFFKPSSKYLEFLQKREDTLAKDVGSGGGAFIGGQLAMGEMKKGPQLPKGWKPFSSKHPEVGDVVGFHHPEHQSVTVHKDPKTSQYHVRHLGQQAGVLGQKGLFDNPKDALAHAVKYVNAYHSGKVLGRKTHDTDPTMKSEMNKALDAGSAMAAPSQLTGGAVLSKESLERKSQKVNALRKEEVCLPKDEAVSEHERLVETLKHPEPKKLKEEAKEQGKELAEMKRSEEKPIKDRTPFEMKLGQHYDIGHSSGQHGKYIRSTAAAHHFQVGDKFVRVPRTKLEKADKLNPPVFSTTKGKQMRAGLPGLKTGAGTSYMGAHVRRGNIGRAKDIARQTLKTKSKWLARAEQAYSTWEKKEAFEKFMQDRLPHLSKGEVQAIGQVIALKKSMEAEGALQKMFASYYNKKEEMGVVPPSKNETNEQIRKTTDIMMACEKKKPVI